MNLLVIGLNHQTAPVEFRERFALPPAEMGSFLQTLVGEGTIREVVIISTCNRVEIYAVGRDAEAVQTLIFDLLRSRSGLECRGRPEIYLHQLPGSLQHLFEVCCGLDSMVVGETEILGQVKDAYHLAHQAHRTGLALNKIFQAAFAVAKEVRSSTRIGMGSVSVGSVAADLTAQIYGDLNDRCVLLLGAGETGETTARALCSRGAKNLVVSNRSPERALTLAEALEGKAVAWEEWPSACEHADIIICSTSAPEPIITRANLEPRQRARKGRPLFLIDLAVPRNIERDVRHMEEVFLYDMDDLQVIAERNLAMRQQEIALCRQIIREKTDRFDSWFRQNSGQIAKCQTARQLDGWRRMFTHPKELRMKNEELRIERKKIGKSGAENS